MCWVCDYCSSSNSAKRKQCMVCGSVRSGYDFTDVCETADDKPVHKSFLSRLISKLKGE